MDDYEKGEVCRTDFDTVALKSKKRNSRREGGKGGGLYSEGRGKEGEKIVRRILLFSFNTRRTKGGGGRRSGKGKGRNLRGRIESDRQTQEE